MPRQQKTAVILFAIMAVLFAVAVIAGIIYLSGQDAEMTGRMRDIFIIVLALESMLIGGTLIILVIQLAVLTNLVKNEIKPILTSAKDTASTLQSTSHFISKRAVAPIISVTSSLAGFRKLGDIIRLIKKK